MIPQQFLDLLVCPLGKAPLRQEGDCLVCSQCGPRFKIARQGYPNLLIEEAELPPGCDHFSRLPCMKDKPRKE